MVLGDAVSKIRDVCTYFEPHFKVLNLVSTHPKNIILGRMTNLNMIFHVVVSVYRTRPSSLLNFGTANYCCNFGCFIKKSDYRVKTY